MGTPSRLVAAIAVSAALALAVPLAEATTPTILSATATAPNEITVKFSEPVKTAQNARTGWSAAGGDLGTLRISIGTSLNLNSGTDTVVFTLNGNLPDTTPDGITVAYSTTGAGCIRDTARWGIFAQYECGPNLIPAGDIADLAGNKLADSSGIPVSDGIGPTFTARATSLDSITLTFSEIIRMGGDATGTWTLSGSDAGTRTISSQGNAPTALTISANLANRNPDLLLTYNRGPGDLADSAGNEPGGTVRVLDRIAPPAPAVTNAASLQTTPYLDVKGTAEANSRMAVYIGGEAVRGTVMADAAGAWSKTVRLAPGDNAITAKATDRSGNTSPASAAVTIRYDPPGTVITTQPGTFTAATQTIRGTAPAASSVSLYRDGDGSVALATGSAHATTGAWSIDVVLKAGPNSIRAVSTKNTVTQASAYVEFTLNTIVSQGNPSAISSAHDGQGIFTTLGGPRDVKLLEQGGKTYALVASGSEDGLQLIDIGDPHNSAPVSSHATSGVPYDMEIADVGSKKFALVATHRSGAVDIFDITNITDIQKVRTVRHDALDPAGGAFSQLRGAKDLDYFTVNSKHYVIVASDAGKTTLFPGGFLIMEFNENVAADGTASAPNFRSVYSNQQKQTDSQGREVLYAQGRGGYGQATFDPFAYFDSAGDPIPVTRSEPIRGYDTKFEVPLGGVSINTWVLVVDKGSDWADPANRATAWKSLTDSRGNARTTDANGHPVQIDRIETAPSRLLVMNDNDTPGLKSDDWLEASFGYGYSKGSIFRSPISERQTPNDGDSKLLSVDASGDPFTRRGQDSAGTAFAALEGAASVDTFAVTKNGATKTYAAIAAEVSDGVQIIDVSNPEDPLAVKAVLDGDLDPGDRTFAELDGATGIETVTVGAKVYAIVASYDDDGFQIIDLSDPASPQATSSRSDAPGRGQGRFSTLDGATGVHTFSRTVAGADKTYAMITATGYDEDRGGGGFQLVDITDPARPVPAGNGRDGERCSTASRYNALGGATSADTAVIGGKLYSVVTGMFDDGIQLVQMDLSRRGSTLTVVDAITDDSGGYFALGSPRSSTVAQINGRTYVFAGSYKEALDEDAGRIVGDGGGVQIIDVTNPERPRPVAGLVDTDNTQFDLLKGVGDIDIFERGGRTYAIVTAQGEYGYESATKREGLGAFMILDVTNPENPRRAAGILGGQPYSDSDPAYDGPDKFNLTGPIGVDTTEIGGRTYAVIASNYELKNVSKEGVSIVDVTNPVSPKPVSWIERDSADSKRAPFDMLTRPFDVETFKIGSKTYAVVSAVQGRGDGLGGLQIIDITNPALPERASSYTNYLLQKVRGLSTININNSHTGNAEKTYVAVAVPEAIGRLFLLDVSDPSSPSFTNGISTHYYTRQPGDTRARAASAYSVDTYHLGEKAYAALTCNGTLSNTGHHCRGASIFEITAPHYIAQRGYVEDTDADDVRLADPRGIDTFVSGTTAYGAVASFGDSGVQIIRLGTVADTKKPAIREVGFNPDRGILEITFDELVRTGSAHVFLDRLAVNSEAGADADGRLSGAELITASDDTKMQISLSDAQKTEFAAAFESTPYPELDVSAGAFDDQAGNDIAARDDIEIKRVTTSPMLQHSVLELGPGLVRIFFSEAVDATPASRVDLSKFKVYKLEAPGQKISLSSSSLVTGSDDRTLVVKLDEADRRRIASLNDIPVMDLEAGAVRSSEGGHGSEASSANAFTRVYGDSTPPQLVSAVRSAGTLVLTFTEQVKVEPENFDLDQMLFYRQGDSANPTYLDDGTDGTPDASIATTLDSDAVTITLTPAQAAAMGSHKDLVLAMVLDGGLSAVTDLFGYGIGEASAPLRNPDGTGPALDSSEAPVFGSVGGTLTVTFSEGLWAARTDPSKFHVRDGAGNSDAAGQITPTPAELRAGTEGGDSVKFHLSEESAAAIVAMSDPHLYLDAGAVRGADSDPSAAASAGRDVSEPSQVRPSISSASAQNPGAIRIDFTKPVKSGASAQQLLGAWSLSGPDSVQDDLPLTVLSTTTLSSATESLVLTLQGRLPSLSPDASVVYDAEKAPIADAADSALTLSSATVAISAAPTTDAPTFTAEATALDQITVTFSERVTATGTSGGGGWSISGGDWNSLTVLSRSDISGGSTTLLLNLSGDLPDTKPDGVLLGYDPAGGDVEDGDGNEVSGGQIPVSDGIAPEVSAEYVSRNSVVLTFGEPVKLSSAGAPTGWTVSGADRGAATGAGAGQGDIAPLTDQVSASSATLTLNGNLADKTVLDFTLSYSNGNIVDAAGNALGPYSEKPSDGIRPEIESAVAGTLNSITVVFSEPVLATSTAPSETWTLGGSGRPASVAVNDNPPIPTAATRTTLGLSGNLNDPLGTVTLAYDGGTGDVRDESGNDLASYTALVVLDMPPSVSSARVDGPDRVVIQYSEPVTAAQSDYPSLAVGGQARTVSGLLGGTTATHTISFRGGDPFGTDATGSVSINAPNITDATGNALGAGVIQQPLSDGQSPTVSAEYTARNSVALTFSEPVRLSSGSVPAGWTVSGTDKGAATGASSVSVITTSVTSTSATLTLNGNLADKTLLDFTLSYSGGNIEDDDGNALAPYSATPDDGIAPTVSSAKYTSRNMVDLEFSEPVRLSSGGAPTDWTVSGTDKGAATAASSVSVITTSVTSTSTTLTLDGNLADKTVLDFTLAYAATGNIEDQSGNALAAYSATPDDGIAPKITSAKVTGPNQITIAYSEIVSSFGTNYQTITVDGAARGQSGSLAGSLATVTIDFDGPAAGTDAVGSIRIDSTQIDDLAGNVLGTQTELPVVLTDGQSPTITSAEATAKNKITVEFSEDIASYGTNAQGWSISGGDAAGRTVASGSGSGSSLVLTLSSDLDDTKPDGVLLRYKTSSGDVGSDASSGSGVLADSASNAVAARSSILVSDGVSPEVSSSKYTARNSVELTFSEPVRLSSAGAPTGWSASGADVPATTAGSAISVLTTSATATSATLTLDNNLADKTSLDFTLSYDEAAGNIEDESDNALARYSEKPDDGLAPRITSAKATGLDEITVTFSENMNISDTTAQGWSVSGTDATGRTVDSSTAVSNGDTVVLTLGSDMEDTKPDGVLLQYKTSPGDVGSDPGSGSGAIADPSSNALAARQSIPVSDGIAPTATAEATALDRITVTFSEPVSVPANAQGWSISGTDAAGLDVTASTSTSSGLSTVLTLSGNLADTNPDNAVLRYKTSAGNVGSDADSGSGAIEDPDSNALAARQNMPVSDGLAPTASFALTDDRAITVSFSEPVSSPDNDASYWTLSGADAAGLAISSVSSLTSAAGSMTVALDGDVPAPSTDLKLAYSAGGTIQDGANLALAAVPATAVSDDRRPSILSATAVNPAATGPSTIVVVFTRDASSSNTPAQIAAAWSVSGTDATVNGSALSVSGASSLSVSTKTLTLTLDGRLPDTRPDLDIAYDSTPASGTAVSITDANSRAMADASVAVADGIAPAVEKAEITGPTTITITYSEAVTAGQTAYSPATVDNQFRQISNVSGSGTAVHTLTFTNPAGTGATGSVNIAEAEIADASGNAMTRTTGALTQPLADGQKPTITSAKATKLNEITVTFSENVKATGTAGTGGWSISGGDWNSRVVDTRTGISSTASDTLVLTLDGNLTDTKPEGVKLAYDSSSGDVADDAGTANELDSATNIDVSDGVKPEIESAKVTGPRQITIAYSETVTHNLAHYNNINVGGGRFASGFAGANTDTAVLSFAGSNTGTDATGTVQINFGAIRDGSNNALGSGHVTQTLTDGQAPTFTAKATELDKITVTFSENLSILDTTAQGWSVSGTDAAGRTVDSSTAVSNGRSVVLTLSSDMEDTKPDGVVLRYKTSSGDVTGDANSGSGAIADPASNALEAKQSTAVSDGIKPEIESAKVTGPGQFTITYSEAVTASQSHYGSASVGGQTATISSISGQTTATHVVSFTAPNPVGTGAEGSVQIDSTQVKDGSNNALGTSTALSQDLKDGQNPSVASATVADRRTIQVAFSESVRLSGAGTAPFGWAISGTDANSAEVDSISDISESVSGTSATLTLDRDIADTTSPSVTVAYSGGNIEDTSDNDLAAYAAAAADDGIAPRIESAAATSLTTVEVAFSEPVSVPANAQGWSISGTDAAGLDVTASTATSSGLSTVLTLSGNLADTNPDNAVLLYKTSPGNVGSDASSGSGDIADLASNALEARASIPVSDGIAPTASFALTDDSTITVSFSEAVSSSSNAASNWAVSGTDAAGRAISSVSAIAGSAMTIQLGGAALPVPFTDLKLAYDGGGAITDGASLVLAAVPAAQVSDERRPAVTSAEATGPRTIVVTFSRDVSSSASAQDLLSAWSVSGGDADSPARLRVSGLSPLGSETRSMTVTLDGDLPDTKPDGVVLAFDATPSPGTTVEISDSSSRSLADASVTVSDGIAPEVESAEATGPRTIVATFSEGVKLSGAGTAPFGWAISGTDANSAEVASIQGISESVSGTSATLNLDRDIAGTTSPSITVAYSGGNIEDASGNDLAAYAATAADDGIAPTVTSVTATSRNTIAVAFSEPVRLDPAGAPTGWTLSGTDAASRAVSTIAFGSPASTATLTLDGDIADKTNPAVTVAYSGGNIEDASGNDLAAYAAAADDGIAPTFTARATALDKIAVTFSESVTATGTAGAGWSISGGDWNSRTVLSSSDISSGSTSLVLTLSGDLVDTKPDGVVLRYDPAAGDAADAAGNETSGTAAVSDGIEPTIASAESREADKITVTFSEPVSGTATAPGTTWTLSGAGAGGRTVTVYGAFSGTSVELTVSSAFPDPIGAVTLTYASPPGDIKDDADLALAGAGEAVTQNLAPFISSAEATSLNAITVTFSEAVRGTATNPSDTWKLGGADAGTITVSRYPAPSGTSLVLGLSGNLPDTDPDLSLQYVRAAGDVEDLTGTPLESTQSPHVAVSDGLAPALSSAALNEGTGVLTLTFTETVDVSEMNESSISIREQGASSGGVALSASVRTTAADSATVSFELSEQDRQAVIAMTTPQLDLGTGAASDSSSNSSSAASDRPIAAEPDTVRPQLQSASLDEGAGTIVLTFDEKMATPTAAQAARVEIGTSGANIVFAEADITSAVLDSAGTTATMTVSEAKRQEIIAAEPADIDLLSGGLRDVSGTEASSSGTALTATPDTTRPALASAVLNTDDGVLVLSFSETMDASSFAGELAKVSVNTPGDPVRLAGTARADGTNVIVTLEPAVLRSLLAVISAAPNAGAPGLLSLAVPGAAPQFADTSGNAVTAVSGNILIEDGRPPSMVSASVTSSDTIVVRFSEDLADGTVQTSDFSVPGYDVSSVSELSGTVTITMANPDTFTMRDAPGVRTAGPVSDLFGNTLEPGARIQSVNAIMPVMISQFTVSHDGPAKAGDRIQITFRAQGTVAMDAALRVNGQAVATVSAENGFDATYTVPAGAPQGPLKLYVEIVSGTGTPTEFSERDLTGPNAVVDTVPPSVVYASIAGIDSVTVIYSEPVTASASDYAGIEADGASPVPASGVLGSGSKSILVSWSGGGATPSSVRLTAGAVTDAAGNAAAPSQVTAAAARTEVTLEEPGIPLARGTVVGTVTAPSGIEPVVDVSSFTGTVTDPAVIGAGGGSAVFESELRIVTRTFGLPDATFPAGTQAGGLGPLASGGAAFGEAIAISSSSSTAHLSEDQREAYPLLFDGITTTVQVGHPGRDIIFDRPVLLEFDIPLRGALVFSVGTLGVPLPIPACDPSWDTSALPVGQSVPEGWPPGTYDTNACVDEDSDSVWTGHFSLFGVSQPPPRGGSECDDCTPPTLGYDQYGAKLVDAGFAYNGLASDVEYFFTPYPLIESEVGRENTVVLRIYENEGPQNVSHAALAFGLRSGEVISESRAVINYDISFDGTGEVSAIDPDGAIDLDTLAAEHETVQCSPGSELECLQVTIKHAFRAPLEFDIVGTDVWDSQRNSWQNYYNHGIKISGEPLDGRPGIEVNGGELVLHPISPDSTNRDVMISSDGHLFKLSPEGRYEPLSNQSRLYHDIDESMYFADGVPMQGYDREDPEFRDRLYEQVAQAQRVLDSMMPAPEAEDSVSAPAPPDRQAEEERLRAAVAAEQERARLLFEVLFGYLEINGQN